MKLDFETGRGRRRVSLDEIFLKPNSRKGRKFVLSFSLFVAWEICVGTGRVTCDDASSETDAYLNKDVEGRPAGVGSTRARGEVT